MSTTQQQNEDLIAVALQIEAWRTANNLSKADLIRRFPRLLGSDRTLNKILSGDTAQLDVESWLDNYQTALDRMQSNDADAAGDTVLWNDLSGPREARRVFGEMLKTTENDRFAILMGENGMGKTSIFTLLKRQHKDRFIIMQAVAGLTASGFAFAGQLILALDGKHDEAAVKGLPRTYDLRLAALQERLTRNNRRLIIGIEEAQDLGEGAFKLIKTLVNLTPVGFIGAAIPTLWRTLARANFEDVAQLTGNRNGGQIVLTLQDADIAKVIDRTCGEIAWPTPRAKKDFTERLKVAATGRGWMKCISKALRRAVRQAAEEQTPITPDHLDAALLEELADRGVKPIKDAA